MTLNMMIMTAAAAVTMMVMMIVVLSADKHHGYQARDDDADHRHIEDISGDTPCI